jgi:hypothetical protein
MKAKAAGVTCFLLAGDESITMFSVGLAVMPEAVKLVAARRVSEFTAMLAPVYQTPSLENFTPPPKA